MATRSRQPSKKALEVQEQAALAQAAQAAPKRKPGRPPKNPPKPPALDEEQGEKVEAQATKKKVVSKSSIYMNVLSQAIPDSFHPLPGTEGDDERRSSAAL